MKLFLVPIFFEQKTNMFNKNILKKMSTKYKGESLQIDWGLIQQIEQKCKVLNALLDLPENKGVKRVNLSQPDLPIVS